MYCEDNEVDLTAREFDILYLLATNRGIVFSAEEISERVWKEKYFQSNVYSLKRTIIEYKNEVKNEINKLEEKRDINYDGDEKRLVTN